MSNSYDVYLISEKKRKKNLLSLIDSFHLLELRNEEMTIKKKINAGS